MAFQTIEAMGIELEVDFDDMDDVDVVTWMGEIQGGQFANYMPLFRTLFGDEQLAMLKEKLGKPNSRGKVRLRNSDLGKFFQAFIEASEKAKN